MQKYAIIDGSNVVNSIEYSSQPTSPIPGLDAHLIAVQSDIAGPGWTYVNGEFIAPPQPPAPPVPPMPTLAELQAQLATLSAQIAALTPKA